MCMLHVHTHKFTFTLPVTIKDEYTFHNSFPSHLNLSRTHDAHTLAGTDAHATTSTDSSNATSVARG